MQIFLCKSSVSGDIFLNLFDNLAMPVRQVLNGQRLNQGRPISVYMNTDADGHSNASWQAIDANTRQPVAQADNVDVPPMEKILITD